MGVSAFWVLWHSFSNILNTRRYSGRFSYIFFGVMLHNIPCLFIFINRSCIQWASSPLYPNNAIFYLLIFFILFWQSCVCCPSEEREAYSILRDFWLKDCVFAEFCPSRKSLLSLSMIFYLKSFDRKSFPPYRRACFLHIWI